MRFLFFLTYLIAWNNALSQEPEVVIQKGHSAPISALSYSSDGKYIVSGGQDNLVKLWDALSKKEIRSFSGHGRFIHFVKFSPDNKVIYSADFNEIKRWNAYTGKPLKSITATKPVAVDLSSDGNFLACACNGKLLIIDVQNEEKRSLGNSKDISVLHFSKNGKIVFSGHKNGEVKMWNIKEGTFRVFSTGSLPVSSLDYSHIRKQLAIGLGRGKNQLRGYRYLKFPQQTKGEIQIWNVKDDTLELLLKNHIGPVEIMAFSREGNSLVSVSRNYESDISEIKLWDTSDGKEKHNFNGHNQHIQTLALHPHIDQLITGEPNGNMNIWNYQLGVASSVFTETAKPVTFTKYSPEGDVLMSCSENTIHLWNVSTGKLIVNLVGHSSPIADISFSIDGKYIVSAANSAGGQSEIFLWRVESGSKVQSKIMSDFIVESVHISQDNNYLAFGGRPRNVGSIYGGFGAPHRENVWYLVDSKDLKLVQRFEGKYIGQKVRFNSNSNYVVSLNYPEASEALLTLWKIGEEKPVRHFGNFRKAQTFCFHPRENLIAVGEGKYIRFLNLSTGEIYDTFVGHEKEVTTLSFSNDGEYLISGSRDKTVRLWKLANGNQRVFEGHRSDINDAHLSPDGRHFVSGSNDAQIKMWDVKSGEELLSMIALSGRPLEYLIFTSDSYYTGTKKGVQILAFAHNNRAFPFEQFDLLLNRPDLVLTKLPDVDLSIIEDYRNAYQARINNLDLKSRESIQGSIKVPYIEIANADAIGNVVQKKSVTLTLHVEDSVYQLDHVNVWINNVPILGRKGMNLPDKPRSKDISIKLELSAGLNKVEVSVTNIKGIESLRKTIEIANQESKSKPKLFFIPVAVSKYMDRTWNLEYPVKDGKDLEQLLKAKNEHFQNISVSSFYNENATIEKIVSVKKRLQESQVDDVVVIFLAGHGVRDDESNFYYCTYDTDFKSPALRGMSYEDIENLLDGIPARNKLLLVDACYSGDIEKVATQQKVLSKDSAENSRGAIVLRKESQTCYTLMKELFHNLSRESGATVISAAAGNGFAYEGEIWQNGAFTFSLLEGLNASDHVIDKNNDSKIQVSELSDYVANRVLSITDGKQKPANRLENLANDFTIWEINNNSTVDYSKIFNEN